MTAEKHPLETVLSLIERANKSAEVGDSFSAFQFIGKAVPILTTLTAYMGQPQSCAECERLGRENARLRECVRDLGNILSDVGPAFEALHDDWIEIEGCEPYQPILDQVAEIKHMLFEKHAATIAAAGGE